MTRHHRPLPAFQLLIACALAGLGLACQQAEPEVAAPAAERVENAELGVAIAALPDFFKVRGNEGAVIELVPADPAVEGVLTLSATEPESGGINLVAAIEEHKTDLLARPDGVFKGQRELGSPLGVAFYSRGLYSQDGRTMEEVVIFNLHPAGDRKLLLTYVYPSADDSSQRLSEQMFGVLGELEPMAMAAAGEGSGQE